MDTRQLGRILEAQKTLYLEPNDKILVILTESFKDAPISDVLKGFDHHIYFIPDVLVPGQDYDLPLSLLKDVTVVWLISNISISHSPSTQSIVEKGIFLISNPGITSDWEPVINPANSWACEETADRILKAIGGDVGGEIHIIGSPKGGLRTNLKLRVPTQNWIEEVGKRNGLLGTNGIFGEFATSPYDANGIFVLNRGDFLTNPLNEVTDEQIILTIRNNRIVGIEGGIQAKTLEGMLEKVGDEAYLLAEFAFGINPGRPERIQRSVVAEKLLGSIHIATGTNMMCLQETCPEIHKFQNGRHSCGLHIDFITSNPSVFFRAEGQNGWITILKDGKLMV